MKAYIVWMNTEYELAEEAAIAINGHTIPALQDEKNGEEAVKEDSQSCTPCSETAPSTTHQKPSSWLDKEHRGTPRTDRM